ncbi:MAG: SDR family oxidoreductase [Candidatus Eiseniibacteriota bacterium]|nr:MAG: SDR family oxidoreductase [Candidatus Eisenbacteria bacterium]
MLTLEDKVALITGGSRGIGRAVALLFAEAGCDLVINYRADRRSAEAVRRAAEESGVRAMELKADVADRAQVDRMVESALQEFGKIDVLVCNAGIWKRNPIDAMSEEELRETIGINLLGTFHPIAAVVPYMKKQRSGVIINVSSTSGQRGEAFYSPYSATKGALISLTKSLALELAPHNIRVNCVASGWVQTDMTEEVLRGEEGATVLSQIPMGRVASPVELAGPILFLASELSSFITGEVLNVNGGAVLCG